MSHGHLLGFLARDPAFTRVIGSKLGPTPEKEQRSRYDGIEVTRPGRLLSGSYALMVFHGVSSDRIEVQRRVDRTG